MADEAQTDETENFEVSSIDTLETLTQQDSTTTEPEGSVEVVSDDVESKVEEDTPAEDVKEESVEEKTGDDTTADTEGSKPKGVQKRINKVVKEREDAKRKNEALEREIAELKGKKETETESKEPPKESDFETYDKYLDAVDAHEKQVADSSTDKSADKEAPVDSKSNDDDGLTPDQMTALAVIHETLDAADKPEDFDKVTKHKDLKITGEMLEAIAECEDPVKVLYHLGKDQKLSAEIAAGSAAQQARSIAKIDITVESKPSKPIQITGAADTINPVNASDSQKKSHDDMSYSEYEADMNKKERSSSSDW